MVGLKDITTLLEKWPVWKAMSETPARVETLEQKVAKLEAEVASFHGKRPADVCPKCGERAVRLSKTHLRMGSFPNEHHYEDWGCQKCDFREQRTVAHNPELTTAANRRT